MWQKNKPWNTEEQAYLKVKKLFLTELKNTQDRCIKYYHRKYDQERNYLVSLHPEIEKNRICIEKSTKIIEHVLTLIEKSSQTFLKKIADLIDYAQGLVNTEFNNLFMIIFKGKLSKHCLIKMHPLLQNLNQDQDSPLHIGVKSGFWTNK